MWINDDINMSSLLSITATLNSGTYALQAQAPAGGVTLSTFASQAATQTALDSLLAVAGYPWIPIGSMSSVANSQNPRVVAVNLANVVTMADVTDAEGSGLSFNASWRTPGYAPYASAAAAIAGILALTGSVTFP